jgi:hypothetical protein
LGAGALLVAVTGLIGFAHTETGRPLLGWMVGMPGCPVLEGMEPERVEALRQSGIRPRAGSELANSRPAAGFELGRDTRTSVKEKLGPTHSKCRPATVGTGLVCPGDGLASPSYSELTPIEIYLQFNPEAVLVAVDASYETRSGKAALRHLEHAEAELTTTVGPGTTARLGISATSLEQTKFEREGSEFRYADYVARLSATNLGNGRLKVREQYQWLPTPNAI